MALNEQRFNNLFPAFDSLDEVLAYTEAKIPKEHLNDVYAILMAYSNTLLKVTATKKHTN